jgi:hypothetical protein
VVRLGRDGSLIPRKQSKRDMFVWAPNEFLSWSDPTRVSWAKVSTEKHRKIVD